MSSIESKFPKIRVHRSFEEALDALKIQTGDSRVTLTRKLAEELRRNELSVVKKQRGYKFDFKI